jgi:hypothetical protein
MPIKATHRSPRRAVGLLASLVLAAVMAGAAVQPGAADTAPIKIVVYAFELNDFSAGGGIIAPDERDATYLAAATDEAKRMLAESGRYTIIDTAGAEDEPVKQHRLRDCGMCIGPITQHLGAQQGVLGTITRINRTEYTLLIQFFDAATGEPVANYYTSLRMGANYAWARGVTWLMKNRILAKS